MTRFICLLSGCCLSAFVAADVKIIGGEPAPRGEYPFFAALVTADGQHVCGGALIAPQWVLTAAHCLRHSQFVPHSVRIGLEQYRPVIIEKENIDIASTYAHPLDIRNGQYDIALVKLQHPASSTHFLKLDGWESHMELPVGMPLTVIGFGTTENEHRPDVLYQGADVVLEDNKCIEVPADFPPTNFDRKLNICAGYTQAGGDSGGPLMVELSAGNYLGVGLVCRTLYDRASQYTRLSFFAGWIKETMEKNKG